VIAAMATCHPHRHAFRGDRCRACTQLEGVLGLDPGVIHRTPGVEQRVALSIPAACPHCKKAGTVVQEGLWLHCLGTLAGCGWDAILAADPIVPRRSDARRMLAPTRVGRGRAAQRARGY